MSEDRSKMWPTTHAAVLLKSPLRRRLNKLGNGVELERPSEKHFDVQAVQTRAPNRAGQLLIKIMYLSLDGVCLEQRARRRKSADVTTLDSAQARTETGNAETLLTKVGGVVRGLGVGMVVATASSGQVEMDAEAPILEEAAHRTAGPFGVGQIVGGEFGWRFGRRAGRRSG